MKMHRLNRILTRNIPFRSIKSRSPNLQDFLIPSSKEMIVEQIHPHIIHENTNHWVLFSDLHVKSATIDVCEEILHKVNEDAKSRNAGIIFLGDFWHTRGSLNVDNLNRILKVLRSWSQPVIMIPGNHDQVELGGQVHSLEPLQYAFRPEQILMISKPSICLDALWLPYRRDKGLLEDTLTHVYNTPASNARDHGRDKISAVFCHADVKGALMNDNFRSTGGMDISVFPKDTPIYSGHFHKPHTLHHKGVSIRYVGSQYQTSLSEAMQDKYLYCLQRQSNGLDGGNKMIWRESERWKVQFGKRYFKVSSPLDPVLRNVVKGDRVVMHCKIDDKSNTVVRELRDKGVELDMRAIDDFKLTSTYPSLRRSLLLDEDSSEVIHSTDTLKLFTEYMSFPQTKGIIESFDGDSSQSVTQFVNLDHPHQLNNSSRIDIYESLISDGKDIINSLMHTSMDQTVLSCTNKMHDLYLEDIEISNFGPFTEKIRYPLANRGLVLIRGECVDGTGASSNGAGKTSLAMSVMWALTGSLDARLVSESRVANVAHESVLLSEDSNGVAKKHTAKVTLYGSVNGKEFIITRKRSSKKAELSFILDGIDLTKLSVKDTQQAIDEALGVGNGILQRSTFFGQHSNIQSLLTLSDNKFKSELSIMRNVDIWKHALLCAKDKLKIEDKKKNDELVQLGVAKERLKELNDTVNEDKHQRVLLLDEYLGLQNTLSQYDKSAESMQQQIFELESTIEVERALIERYKSRILADARISEVNLLKRYTQENQKLLETLRQHSIRRAEYDEKVKSSRYQYDATTQIKNATEIQIYELRKKLLTKLSEINNLPGTVAIPEEAESYSSECWHINLKNATSTRNSILAEINIRQESMIKLEKLATDMMRDSCTNIVGEKEALECPTCGTQILSETTVANRVTDLTKQLNDLIHRKKQSELLCERVGEGLYLANSLNASQSKLRDLNRNLFDIQSTLSITEKELASAVELCDTASSRIEQNNMIMIERENTTTQDISKHELMIEEMQLKVDSLLMRLDEVVTLQSEIRSKFKLLDLQRAKQRGDLSLLQSRLGDIESKIFKLEDSISLSTAKIEKNYKQLLNIEKKTLILHKLVAVFGVKGIPHFIYLGVVGKLQNICNRYLETLAQGSMQLHLKPNADDEKILKSVLMQSTNTGEWMERDVAQLSGGQLRRVSIALDFAFASLIKSSGLLRTNILVMDEPLNHLDASGREAVGLLLRDLVGHASNRVDSNSSVPADPNDSDTGSVYQSNYPLDHIFDTVFVILQDLSAIELEEYFDHIDVVVRNGDSSSLRIDVTK